jgi:putative ABC transport system permease protein
MIKNYLKIALRNLLKHKVYSLINILGLAVGIAASVLITLYVVDEIGYDRFNVKADRTFRVVADWSNKGDSRIHQLGTPWILAKTLRDNYPQAEAVTQLCGPGGVILARNKESAIKENDAFAADASFFDVFPYSLIKGDPASALKDPSSIVLSESLAAKCFGSEDPMNKTVEMVVFGEKSLCKVTGVLRDVPRNSHFRFEVLVSMGTIFPQFSDNWTSNNFVTYLLLKEGVTRAAMEGKLAELERLYFSGRHADMPWVWTLEPIREIHLRSDLVTGNQPNGSVAYVRLFAVIAVLILLIAGINFVNLSTARSARRAREVGIRKTVGSLKGQLVSQFLGESVLMSFFALLISIGLVQAALPFYRTVAGRGLRLDYFGSPFVIPGLVGLALAVGLLAGLYPAFFLSSFKQTDVLKGAPTSRKGRRSLALRNGLVVFQFATSVFLIIGSMVIFRQLDFVKNSRLGFDKDHVVVLHNTDNLSSRFEAFKDRLRQNPAILGVTAVSSVPGEGTPNWGIGVEGIESERPMNMNFLTCDQDLADVLSIRMAEGRFLSRKSPSDATAVVINRKAAQYFGVPDPIGKKVRVWWTKKDLTIVGIIEDFHFESLHRGVLSMGYILPSVTGSTGWPNLLVKINASRNYDVLAFLRETWQSFAPGLPFEFAFMDEKIDALYQNDTRAGKIVSLFSFLAVFVSCLGLFGLAAFVTEQRTKEIGVRKILGARLANILWLLTGQFIRWVVAAILIAWPLSFWIMNRWLQGFAFRTVLSPRIFLASGLAAILIAAASVGFQVFRAAVADPARSLKYE